MAAFATLMARLGLDTADFNKKLADATEKMNKASEKMSKFATTTNESYGRATAALKSHNLGLKDTARIVQGIMVSQVFYGITQNISNAASALWDFNVALDYAKVTYSALFGDTKVASDFMDALQEHSINTIFDYQGLADSSKKLLAYGIDYKNLMFIIEGLTNLGTMSGDAAALDRIALALGQIYTKGKLSAEEMRQLANAYIPITDILQSKFGLTGDDLKRVGDLNLPANEVINAIIDYANENFGSVGDAAMFTITGLQNKIVDTLKVVGTEMLSSVTTVYKSFLAYVSNGLAVIRDEYASGGIGGIFEHLVPNPNTQQLIRQFLANVHNLFMSLTSVGIVVGQVFGNIASVFMTAFNIMSPAILGAVNLLSAFLNAVLNNRTGAALLRVALLSAAAAFVVLRVQATAALVISAVTKAVAALSKALLLLSAIILKHPILSLIAALAVGLIGVSTASNGANGAISGLFDTLSGIGGVSSDDILKRTEQELQDGASAADQFNNRLEEGGKKAEEMEKGVGGIGKAASDAVKKLSGLLSFDEVFKLQDPNKSSGSGGSGGGVSGALDDFADLMSDIGGIGDALIPDIPDFSDFISGFTDGLFGGLRGGIMDSLASAGIGALIGGGLGAIIGGLLGGPAGAVLGAKIGAFAGGLVGFLWEALDGAISNTIVGAMSGMAAAIGKAFTLAFSNVVRLLASGTSIKNIFSGIAYALKTTGLKSLLKGGIIGAAIGLVVDSLAHTLWGNLAIAFEGANEETAKVGQTIGSVIGAIIGGIIGGPAGAIIGSAIGTFAGGLVGLFWEPIKEYFDPDNNALTRFFVDTGKLLDVWSKDTLVGLSAWWIDTLNGFSDWFSDTTSGFSTWWGDTTSGFSTWWGDTKSGLSSWWDETVKIFSDWDSINGDTLSSWWSSTKTGFADWWHSTFTSIDEWAGGTLTTILGWVGDTYNSFASWVGDTFLKIAGWQEDTRNGFRKWSSNALKPITDWCTNALGSIGSWVANTWNKFTEWVNEVNRKFDNFATDAKNVFDGIMVSIGKAIDDGLTDVGEAIGDFFGIDNLWQLIKDGVDGITNKLKSWWEGIGNIFSGEINASPTVNVTPSNGARGGGAGNRASLAGHARGGIFDREHIARFAEGNKREAIIPLENPGAMKPFVDAVSGGLISTLAPVLASANAAPANTLPPLYVGTLIADDRGIEQLYRKFQIIQLQENDRKGLPTT